MMLTVIKKKIETREIGRAILVGCLFFFLVAFIWYYAFILSPAEESQSRQQVLQAKAAEFQKTHNVVLPK